MKKFFVFAAVAAFALVSCNKDGHTVDGSGDIIIRLYECKHAATDALLKLNIPAIAVFRCDLLENEQEQLALENGCVSLNLHGFEVVSLRIKR